MWLEFNRCLKFTKYQQISVIMIWMNTSDKLLTRQEMSFKYLDKPKRMLEPIKITAAAWVPVVPINLKVKSFGWGCLP